MKPSTVDKLVIVAHGAGKLLIVALVIGALVAGLHQWYAAQALKDSAWTEEQFSRYGEKRK